MKDREKDTALSAKVRLAAEKMPPDVRERVRHRIVARLDKAAVRPAAYRRVAAFQFAAILLAAMTLLGGTAYAISRSQPGDFLYPVKESVAGIARVLPFAERSPDEPAQREVAPEPESRPIERGEEPGATGRSGEPKDPSDAPGRPASEETERDAGKPRDSGEDYDEAAPDEGRDEPASGQYRHRGPRVRGESKEAEEKSEVEYQDGRSSAPQEPSGSSRGHQNGYPED